MAKLKSELQILIAELEAEAKLLRNELNKCLLDANDYKGAHWFQKCLRLVNTKLYVLRNLENPNSQNIKKIDREIGFLKTHITDQRTRISNNFVEGLEKFYLEKLKKLEAQKLLLEHKPAPFHIEGEVLYNLLGRLVSNEITNITIQLDKYRSHLFLTRLNGGLQIEVSKKDFCQEPENIFHDKWSGLAGMGFVRTETGAGLHLSDFDLTLIDRVIEILSRLIYDVLHVGAGEQAKIVVGW